MKVALLVFTITLLAAGCYAGRYLEIYSDSNCVDLVAVDWVRMLDHKRYI